MRFRGSLRKLLRDYLGHRGLAKPVTGRRPHNWTPPDVEEEIVRLHVGSTQVDAGQLRQVVHHVLGATLARETIRTILHRNRPLMIKLEAERNDRAVASR